jgi:uncharacterized protein (DUF362 family)
MLSRRDVLGGVSVAAAASAAPVRLAALAAPPPRARVVVVKSSDRARAVAACLDALDLRGCRGGDVAVKANYNSDDPFPALTHPATLGALLGALRQRGAARLTVAERSGMGDTRRVLHRTGAVDAARSASADLVVLDEIPRDGWQPFTAEHWPHGLHPLGCSPRRRAWCRRCAARRTASVGTSPCRSSSVGLLAKRLPGEGHDYMRDLHGSPHQRAMIAEANLAWRPAVSVLDCLEAFVDGGPERGTAVTLGVFLASEDRCALDAAAIALLRLHGLKGPAARGTIGATDQLAPATALGLGARPDAVDVVATDAAAHDIAGRLTAELARG